MIAALFGLAIIVLVPVIVLAVLITPTRKGGEGRSVARIILTTALFLSIGTSLLFAEDYRSRYFSWKSLSEDKIVDSIAAYDRRYGVTDPFLGSYACLYVVECDKNGARLSLINDIEELDFKALKQRIWDRRFKNYCTGAVTNLGLEFSPAIPSPNRYARWSFYNDRFIPRSGRFQSGAFSVREWESCTKENAIYFRPDTPHQ